MASDGRVILDMAISLDGFTADRDGASLYPIDTLRGTDSLNDLIAGAGAVVMGRRAYDMARGDFTGYEYQVPIFVLTHNPPTQSARGLTFTFVTAGPAEAVRAAKATAGGKDVIVIGGANTAQQCIRQRLVDRIRLRLVPVLLGDGLRLFEHLDPPPVGLTRTPVSDVEKLVNLQFDVTRSG